MNKKNSQIWVIILIILTIVSVVYLAFKKNNDSEIDKKTTECIASKSIFYISSGCVACASQEKLFGENFQYLNVIDCKTNKQDCIEANIIHVPAWFINGTKYEGVQSIEELKNLTGC